MDGGARGVETQDTQDQTEQSNANVEHGEGNLLGAGEPLAPVEVEPVDTAETVTEPTSEEGALQID